MVEKREYPERRLSRREREIMDIVYRLGEVSVAELAGQLADPPTDGAARRMLNVLESKGFLRARHEGPKKIYSPTVRLEAAQESALRRVVETFFEGSAVKAMASIFEESKTELSESELEFLRNMIERAKKEGR
jgi:predicted transcriptional regulator